MHFKKHDILALILKKIFDPFQSTDTKVESMQTVFWYEFHDNTKPQVPFTERPHFHPKNLEGSKFLRLKA